MEETKEMIGNFKIIPNKKSIVLFLNPKLYMIEAIYGAIYSMMDKVHGVLLGDIEKQIIVYLFPLKYKEANEDDLINLAFEFNDNLINQMFYLVKNAETKEVRDAIVKKALFQDEESEEILDENLDANLEYNDESCVSEEPSPELQEEYVKNEIEEDENNTKDNLENIDESEECETNTDELNSSEINIEDVFDEDIQLPWEEKFDSDETQKINKEINNKDQEN